MADNNETLLSTNSTSGTTPKKIVDNRAVDTSGVGTTILTNNLVPKAVQLPINNLNINNLVLPINKGCMDRSALNYNPLTTVSR